MNTEKEQYVEMMIDRIISIRTSLWNTLFVFNGAMLTILGIFKLPMLNSTPCWALQKIKLIIIGNILSMFLILLNFIILEFDTIGWLKLNIIVKPEQQKNKENSKNKISRIFAKIIKISEIIIIFVAIIEVIIIITIIF